MTIYWKIIDKFLKKMIGKYKDTIAIAVFGYNRPKELEGHFQDCQHSLI